MNNSLRLELVNAGFPDRSMETSIVSGCKPSPTLDACYRLELYSDRKTLWGLKKKAIKSRDYAHPYISRSKGRLLRAMAFEAQFQATRKADRALTPTRTTTRVQPTKAPRVGSFVESFA